MSFMNYKQAVLRLAVMHPADRRWILQRLPESSRTSLDMHIQRVLHLARGDMSLLQEILAEEHMHPAQVIHDTQAVLPPASLPDTWRAQLDGMMLPPKLAAALQTAGGQRDFATSLRDCDHANVEVIE